MGLRGNMSACVQAGGYYSCPLGSIREGAPMSVETSLSARDQESLRRAAEDFSAGRYEQAVAVAGELCRKHPRLQVAFKLQGSALHVAGRSEEAVPALTRATLLGPDDAQAWSNLGNALAATGMNEAAADAHRRAIELQPDNPTLHHNLGCVFLATGSKDEALEQFLLAYERAPDDAELAQLCRELLAELEDWTLAERFCRSNLERVPNDAGAAGMLGGILLQRGLIDEAERFLRVALEREPDDAVAWSNLSVALRGAGRFQEAVAAGRRAVDLAPDWSQACNNFAVALRDAGQLPLAKDMLLRAIGCDPDVADPYYNLGCACTDLGDSGTAREALIEAVKRQPRMDWIVQAAHACRQVADWEGAELLEAEFFRQLEAGVPSELHVLPSPFACLATPDMGLKDLRPLAAHFAAQYASRERLARASRPERALPLKLGLLSADFRDHATAHLLVGLLESLCPESVTVFAYDYGPTAEDAYSSRLRRAVPNWVSLREMSDLEAARRIAQDGIDIAIDLKGWTQGYRAGILAHRPALLQMQWLGFPGTMGASWIDYIIADSVTVPEGAEEAYSESIMRLPDCYQPNDRLRAVAPTPARAALGLPEDALVLAAMHQPYKITRRVFDLWMRLLKGVPDTVLWLLDAPGQVRLRLIDAARAAEVDPGRLIWAPRLPIGEHLGRLAAADLALDTFPVGAHTTASDALWAGVPQVAHCGESFASRVSASIVKAAGMPELVADTEAHYEALVLDLLADRQKLTRLRQELLAQRDRCALFDTPLFAERLVRGLEIAWARARNGQPPAHILVPE